jgi:hypothetical protein
MIQIGKDREKYNGKCCRADENISLEGSALFSRTALSHGEAEGAEN